MSDEFVAYNRYAATGIASEGTQLVLNDGDANGLIRLLDPDWKSSFRFTFVHGTATAALSASGQTRRSSETLRRAVAVWLYAQPIGDLTGIEYEVSIHANDEDGDLQDGVPVEPALAGPVTIPALVSGQQWVRVPVYAPNALLTSEEAYHVVVRHKASSAPPSVTNYLKLFASRSRHPMPFMPYHASTADTPQTPFDEELAAMILDDCGEWLIKQHGDRAYSPVFLVEHTALRKSIAGGGAGRALFGNPYNRHDEPTVQAAQVYGERLRFPEDTTVNYAAMFTGATSPTRPCGDLLVEIYEDDGSTVERVASAVLINGQCSGGFGSASGSRRWHWYGAYFDPVVLDADFTYYLVLASPESGVHDTIPGSNPPQCDCSTPGRPDVFDSWVMPIDGCSDLVGGSFPASAGDVPTFMTTEARAISAVRSRGANPTLSGVSDYGGSELWDAGLILGDIADSGRPLAMNDETGGLTCSGEDFRLSDVDLDSLPDDVVIAPVMRNIGGANQGGELYCELVGPGAISSCETYAASIANSDVLEACGTCADAIGSCTITPARDVEVPFDMPRAPASFRYYLEFGWRDGSGVKHVDERSPYEIRQPATSNCCP